MATDRLARPPFSEHAVNPARHAAGLVRGARASASSFAIDAFADGQVGTPAPGALH